MAQDKTAKKSNAPDQALLARFKQVCQQLDNFRGNYTMGGTVIVDDKSIPGNKADKVDYMFCKHGDEFYYQMGKTVTINEQGVYLYIDPATRTIMLSPQKKVNYETRLKQFADVATTISSENYTMSRSISGNEETISLINEHHISCKQYSITFDKRTLKIRRLYTRLTNIHDPSRTDNEETIEVLISRWDDTADLSGFLTKDRIVKNIKGRWVVSNAYKNYRLVNM